MARSHLFLCRVDHYYTKMVNTVLLFYCLHRLDHFRRRMVNWLQTKSASRPFPAQNGQHSFIVYTDSTIISPKWSAQTYFQRPVDRFLTRMVNSLIVTASRRPFPSRNGQPDFIRCLESTVFTSMQSKLGGCLVSLPLRYIRKREETPPDQSLFLVKAGLLHVQWCYMKK